MKHKLNKKDKGFLLLEFLVTSLLASFLLIIIYQAYQTAHKGVQYVRYAADFQMQKNLFLYQLELDSLHIIIPDFIYDLYPLFKKKFKDNEDDKDKKEKKEDKIDEKEKKELEKNFKEASVFFPEAKNTLEEKYISWVSSRKILGKSELVKVTYLFKITEKIYKEKKLYRFYRREDIIESDFSIKKKGNEYSFISYVLDPDIVIIMPKIEMNENKENKEKDNKDSDDKFLAWVQKPLFKVEKELLKFDISQMTKKIIIPFTVIFNGIMVSYDLSKERDLSVTVSFPIADYAMQVLLNCDFNKDQKQAQGEIDKNKENNQKTEGKKDNEKNPVVANEKNDAPIKPINVNIPSVVIKPSVDFININD
jgi:competence protein ComGC